VQLHDLWTITTERFGKVDIWINNAGVANRMAQIWELPPEQLAAVVDTNVLGTMYGAHVAINGMLAQGYGAIYNMEGMGSNGRKQDGMTLYGTSKAAIRYLTDALILETKGTPLVVGSLSPGMVSTGFVIDQFQEQPELWQQSKRVLSIIMDDVDTVAPWLARRVLENDKHGARITWLTRRKMAGRFL
jgi:NAD(P)-dependent dehydrogenase (short-subunit alcohol dehydrogenase family)